MAESDGTLQLYLKLNENGNAVTCVPKEAEYFFFPNLKEQEDATCIRSSLHLEECLQGGRVFAKHPVHQCYVAVQTNETTMFTVVIFIAEHDDGSVNIGRMRRSCEQRTMSSTAVAHYVATCVKDVPLRTHIAKI